MGNVVRYVSTKYDVGGKQGKLLPDKDGYYDVILGAFNVHNSGGNYWTDKNIEALYDNNSEFQRRTDAKSVRCELDHPSRLPGMTDREFVIRILTIKLSNTCGHFKEIRLDYDYAKTINNINDDAIITFGKVIPSGPHSKVLKDTLENPCENTSFSIRSFTKDFTVNGVVNKELVKPVTYDLVNEPGIAIANKMDFPSTEEFNSLVTMECDIISIGAIKEIVEDTGISTESVNDLAEDLLRIVRESRKVPNWKKW